MKVKRVEGTEVSDRIDQMWDSYLVSFPEDAKRTKEEMEERVQKGSENGYTREIFFIENDSTELETVGIYHINENLPFCYGEYIWSNSKIRSRQNGENTHKACIDHLRSKNIAHFICEGHEDNPWHHRIGLGLVPIDYLQPAISPEQQDVNMTLLYDMNLGGNNLKTDDLLGIVDEIYKGIYGITFRGTKYENIMIDSIQGRRNLIIK